MLHLNFRTINSTKGLAQWAILPHLYFSGIFTYFLNTTQLCIKSTRIKIFLKIEPRSCWKSPVWNWLPNEWRIVGGNRCANEVPPWRCIYIHTYFYLCVYILYFPFYNVNKEALNDVTGGESFCDIENELWAFSDTLGDKLVIKNLVMEILIYTHTYRNI